MNNCGTCKWWEGIDEVDRYPKEHGECGAIREPRTTAAEAKMEAFTQASNDIGSVLYTKATFGCTLWEAKDD